MNVTLSLSKSKICERVKVDASSMPDIRFVTFVLLLVLKSFLKKHYKIVCYHPILLFLCYATSNQLTSVMSAVNLTLLLPHTHLIRPCIVCREYSFLP